MLELKKKMYFDKQTTITDYKYTEREIYKFLIYINEIGRNTGD